MKLPSNEAVSSLSSQNIRLKRDSHSTHMRNIPPIDLCSYCPPNSIKPTTGPCSLEVHTCALLLGKS